MMQVVISPHVFLWVKVVCALIACCIQIVGIFLQIIKPGIWGML